MTDDRVPVILVVCLGNICRSPTAEAALRSAARDAQVDVEVVSAGTGGWHVGETPDRRMTRAAAEVGLHLDGTAQRVTAEAIENADVVFAMDQTNLDDVRRLAQSAGIDTPIHLFRAFDPLADGPAEVPDPYYGGPDGFAEVVEICRRTARAVIDRLDELIGAPSDA